MKNRLQFETAQKNFWTIFNIISIYSQSFGVVMISKREYLKRLYFNVKLNKVANSI